MNWQVELPLVPVPANTISEALINGGTVDVKKLGKDEFPEIDTIGTA